MRQDIERWYLQSKEEYETAKISLNAKKYFAAAFWAQQSVEKALKALFMHQKKESAGVTHSLTFLARQTGLSKEFYEICRDLTKEYYMSRYPDATEDVPYRTYTKETVEKQVADIEKILKWVEQQLHK